VGNKMLPKISNKTNQLCQYGAAQLNAATLCIAGGRQDLMGYKPDMRIPSAAVSDVCTVTGAYVAATLLFPVKWIVGCGVKPQPLAPKNVSTIATIEQHGLVASALRAAAAKAGSVCGVEPQDNLGISLADAATAALRFVVLTLPEAAIVSLFFLLSIPVQIVLDFAAVILFFCQLGLQKMQANSSLKAVAPEGEAVSAQPTGGQTASQN
jgi:hypothetical protein